MLMFSVNYEKNRDKITTICLNSWFIFCERCSGIIFDTFIYV